MPAKSGSTLGGTHSVRQPLFNYAKSEVSYTHNSLLVPAGISAVRRRSFRIHLHKKILKVGCL